MTYKNDPTDEVREPVAHPHYPTRPQRAARPIYTIMEEENEESDLSANAAD